MTKPHIQVDANPLASTHFSGVGHYTLEIVRGFDAMAREGKLTYSLVVHRRLFDRLDKYGLEHFDRIIRNPLPDVAMKALSRIGWFPVNRILGEGSYYFPSFIAWPTGSSRSATVIHDVTYLAVPECVHPANCEFLLQNVPRSLKYSQHIIAVSEFSKAEIVKHYDVAPERITVVYPSVDRGHFYKRPGDQIAKVRGKYGIPAGKYILCVGNIEPRKNYARLLEAYTSLPLAVAKDHPLVIVGAGGWNNEGILTAIANAQSLGYPVIHPSAYVTDDDMPALYSGAQFFVFVPIYEGFGMPPLEALACGTPAVVSGVSSLPESVGDAATFVDPFSVDDIKSGLLDMIDATRHDRGQFDAKISKHLASLGWRKSAEITAACLTGLPRSHFAA